MIRLQDFVTSTRLSIIEAVLCAKKALSKNALRNPKSKLAILEDRVLFSAVPVMIESAEATLPTSEPMTFATSAEEIGVQLAVGDETDEHANTADHTSPFDTRIVRNELVFVDSAVPDLEQLLNDLWTDNDPSRDVEVVLLSNSNDGIEQISNALANRSNLDAIHLVSHGTDGRVKLGEMWLGAQNLDGYAGEIASWGKALNADGDLLIYGCDLAKSDDGRDLIDSIGVLCDCDVAASEDLTGHANLGGDWDLEYSAGEIESDFAFSTQTQQSWMGLLAAPVASNDPGNFAADLLALNPLSYWRLGEASGPTATDIGSSANDGNYNGGTLAQTGAINGDNNTAIQFDGSIDYVEVVHSNDYLLDNGTVQLWFNADTPAGGDLQHLFSKDSSGLDTGGHVSIYLNATGQLEVRLQSTTANYVITSASAVTGGTWHHAAFTFGTQGMTLYLDGQLVGTDAYTGGLGTTSGGAGNFEPIAFGGGTTTSGNLIVTPVTQFFAGRIDEVAILNSQLDAETVQDLYAAGLQHFTIHEGESLNVAATAGVLANDFDADGDPLTTVLVSGPSDAAAFTLNFDGSFDYTPNVGFSGVDSFTYRANDGSTDSNIATVSVTVVDRTLVVDTTNDLADGDTSSIAALVADRGADGMISLREAILATNNTPNINSSTPDRIHFEITDPLVGGVHRIGLLAALPIVNDALIIDGTTDADFATPVIELDGSLAAGAQGLHITAGNTTIRGLIINQFDANGLYMTTNGGNIITGNYIGLDGSGVAAPGNVGEGIRIESGSNNNIIGGTTVLERNLIGGNEHGILIHNSSGTVITGNYIGTDVTGMVALANRNDGIAIGNAGADNNRIGGTNPLEGNIISGGLDGAIVIHNNANGNIIQGNLIGTDVSGTANLGNAGYGIRLRNGAQNTLIGGTALGAANTIAFNALDGVRLSNSAGSGNSILGNSIFINGELGIDLNDDGVTSNDINDADLGTNSLQNFPVITSAGLAVSTLTLNGTLDTDGLNTQYRLEFFGNVSGTQDPTNGESRYYLGTTTITTDGSGDGVFSGLVLSGITLGVGDFVTATATRIDNPAQVGIDDQQAYGSTSELAANFAITNANGSPTDITPNSFNVNENTNTTGGFSLGTLSATDPDTGETFSYSILPGGDGALFSIGGAGSNEVIMDDGIIDFETKPSYTVNVRVTDSDTNTYDETLTVNVTNLNEAPTIALSPVVVNLNEDANTSGPIIVATIAVTDDALGSETLNLSGTDSAMFEIVGSDLRLVAGASLDFESNPVLNVSVNVDDATIPGNPDDFDTHTVVINDIDEFDVGPITDIDLTGNVVSENASGATVGVTAAASDADGTNNTITYSLFDNDGGRFTIDPNSGVVTTAVAIDREADGPTRFITVRASSSDGSFTDQTFAININDIDEFDVGAIIDSNPAANEVAENSGIGALVGMAVQAMDADATNNTISYTLDNDSGGRFNIHSVTGVISTLTALNYESQNSHSIVVRATSSDGSSMTQNFTIMVLDLNEQPTATSDAYAVISTNILLVSPFGVLDNDSDVDGDSLTALLVGGPAHGTLTWNGDGSFLYDPDNDFFGTDSFLYQAFDGSLNSAVISVSITVLPVGDGGSSSTDETEDTNKGEETDTSDTEEPSEITTISESVATETLNPLITLNVFQRNRLDLRPDDQPSPAIATEDQESVLNVALFESMTDDSSLTQRSSTLTEITRFRSSDSSHSIEPMTKHVLTLFSADREESSGFDETSPGEFVIGTTAIVSTTLSVGYIAWLLRSGALFVSFLTAIPAWCSFDPLPIIESFESSNSNDDDESLVSMVENPSLKMKSAD